ncbi:putative gustatory receptor clone PTE03 [Fundulus heteroclitus]|uniref:putative gustatory receptor clone PTE03 n=1 Tax=Fundulus heteroclitus TaxID=8078 RepID=UPI00165AF0FB|nr:putative gustatory receptor clone PTE03 [Fundulus heteroclitus]
MMINASMIGSFTLLGLKDTTAKYRLMLFALTLLCYTVIILVNVALIATIILEEKLHKPMYIFLCNLCFNSLYGTAAFHPKFLFDLLSGTQVISYAGCLLQVYFIYSYATTDFSILAVMSYDRYLAICRPLEYHSIMTKQRVILLVCFSRLVPMICQAVVMIMTAKLTLCGFQIEKLYCDNWSILKLSCYSIILNNIVGYIVILLYTGHGLFVLCSYIQLVKFSLKYPQRRRKFLQTCAPHLICLINVLVTLLFDVMYARYGSESMPQSLKNFMAIQFLIIPPMLNPILYGLNLTQVRNSCLRICKCKKQMEGSG